MHRTFLNFAGLASTLATTFLWKTANIFETLLDGHIVKIIHRYIFSLDIMTLILIDIKSYLQIQQQCYYL